ncbi:MAG TPA: adenosine deaminase [Anaerolineae bacterium]|nr:adenosine deaminase [Anaerolineae bacterium]
MASRTLSNPAIYAHLKQLPKIDLHRHLEGSLRVETLFEIARRHNMSLPTTNIDLLRPHVQVLDDEPDFQNFLSKFSVLRRFYRSEEIIMRLTYEAVADAARDNVHYLELRFSPQALARLQGFSFTDVTDWVIAGVEQAQAEFGIQVGLIVTLLRHEPDLSHEVAALAFSLQNHIVGLDLAGDEVNFSAEPFIDIFQEAERLKMGITVHAGEWCGAEEVQYALENLHAMRLGHGVRIIENHDVVQLAKAQNIAFEVCLTSNLQTGVVKDMGHHPLGDLLQIGLLATVNTDDPSVSSINLTDEYYLAVSRLNLKYHHMRKMLFNAVAATFLPPAKREALQQHFEAFWPQDEPAAWREAMLGDRQ